MQDPVHLLANLVEYMDYRSGHAFGRLFEFDITSSFACVHCGKTSIVFNECLTQALLHVHPDRNGSALHSLIQQELTPQDPRHQVCQFLDCAKTTVCASKFSFSSISTFLCVHIVWNISPDLSIPIIPFEIPLQLNIPPNTSLIADDQQHGPWHLLGIVCRLGNHIETGHYVAILKYRSSWWLVNDDRVRWVESPSDEAFLDGRYPVLVIYDNEDSNQIVSGECSSDAFDRS